jgi:hypothetical protein
MPIILPTNQLRGGLVVRGHIEALVMKTADAVLAYRPDGMRLVRYDIAAVWEPLDRVFRRSEDYV